MCQNAFRVVYDIVQNSLTQLVREVKAGDTTAHPRMEKSTTKLTKESYVESWLDVFFKGVADIMPDCNGRETQHLPEWMTYKWIYNKFLSDPNTILQGNEMTSFL